MKTAKQLERYFKGASNHWRIEILKLVGEEKGITLEKISKRLGCSDKTISGHTHRLVQAGLLDKKYRGRAVEHALSPYGKRFLEFARSFE